jgi:dipeptidase
MTGFEIMNAEKQRRTIPMTGNILKSPAARWMGAVGLFVAVLFLASGPTTAVPPSDPDCVEECDWGCTSIQVGRLATTDGSVITCHTCDGNYRMWLNIVPRAKWPENAVNKVYRGKMHTETAADLRGIVELGSIPQVPETFAYFNVAYPGMNEHGLMIGETTIGGRRELYNSEGLFMIEEIQRIVLERCKTAREAIELAGKLVKEYGYGDNGECLTFADSREVWHFEIFGAGPFEKGAVWAAVRIPDDHVGVSANIPRISEIDLKNPERYMASDNVFSVAEEMGWWDPQSGEPFKFWKAYSGRKPFAIRDFFILSTLAPSLNLSMDAEELPFSVKPEKKLSVRDVLALYRETYEGTAYDMTQNLKVPPRPVRPGSQPADDAPAPEMVKSPLANPWMSRDLMALFNALKPGAVEPQRTIAISACAYATVLQGRSWLPPSVGTICWFAFDNPAQSARIPIFAGVTELPPSFEVCAQHRFRTDSAAWAFRRAARLSTVRWGDTRKVIEDTIKEFEDKAFADLPLIEKKVLDIMNSKTPDQEPFTVEEYLTKYTNDFARAAIQKYWELGDKFWAQFARGF